MKREMFPTSNCWMSGFSAKLTPAGRAWSHAMTMAAAPSLPEDLGFRG